MEIDERHFKHLLEQAVKVGRMSVVIEKGEASPFVSKKEAYRLFKRSNVDRWIAGGLIAVCKDGDNSSTCRLDREQLEILAGADHRCIKN